MSIFRSRLPAVRGLAASAALVLLLAGRAEPAPAPPAVGGDAGDLKLVPHDAQGMLSLRMADAYKVDVIRRGLQALEKQNGGKDLVAEVRKQTGLVPADVERLTVVFADSKANVGWLIVATVKPYDRARLLDKFTAPKAIKHRGRTYHAGKLGDSNDVAVHFVNQRVAVYADEAGMKRCLSFLDGKKNKGPLEDAVKLASGKRHLVGAVNPAVGLRELREEAAKLWKPFGPLLDLETATLALDFGAATQVELSVRYPTVGKANDGRKAAEGVKAAVQLLGAATVEDAFKQALPPAQAKEAYDAFASMLDSYKVEHQDKHVRIKMKIENKLFEALMAGLPKQ